jgi:hypothetical protein
MRFQPVPGHEKIVEPSYVAGCRVKHLNADMYTVDYVREVVLKAHDLAIGLTGMQEIDVVMPAGSVYDGPAEADGIRQKNRAPKRITYSQGYLPGGQIKAGQRVFIEISSAVQMGDYGFYGDKAFGYRVIPATAKEIAADKIATAKCGAEHVFCSEETMKSLGLM